MNIKEQIQAKQKEREELEKKVLSLKKEILELEKELEKLELEETAFDKTLKGVLSVPKPPKD